MADMADAAMSGPMQTPEPTMEDFAVVEQIRQEVPASEINETLLSTAVEADPIAVAEFKAELRDLELPVEVLDVLNDMVDEILASPDRYAEIRAHYKTKDMPDEMLPETFDPEFFGALNMALDEIRATSGEQARAPQRFAKGGVASLRPIASAMAEQGRYGDTMLAHISPIEADVLKRMGGSGTINPRTGLPEFFLKGLGKIFKKIGKAVKKFAKSTIGKIVISTALFLTLGPMAAGALGLQAGTVGAAAVSGFVAGAGSSLLAGNNLKDSLKAGAIGGVTAGAVQGISTAVGGPADITKPLEKTTVDVTDVTVSPDSLVDVTAAGTPTSPGIAAPPTDALVSTPVQSVAASPLPVDKFSIDQATKLAMQNDPGSLAGGVASLPSNPGITKEMYMNAAVQNAPPAGSQTIVNATAEAPGFFESIKETFTPDRSVGLGERATSFKDAFSPTAIKNRAIASSGEAYQPAYDAVFSATQDTAAAQAAGLKAMEAAASPSLLSQYGPLAGAGAGIMALSGGFDTPQPEAPAGFEDFMAGGGQRLLEENPEKYGLRFGGIQPLSSLYTNYAPPTPTYNAAKGSGPKGVAPDNFPRMNGPINGPGTGTSDDVPAMLSDGEFVFTAKAVRNMGDGSRRKGAKRMYAMMKKLENRANG